ncbi:MAG: hypothetical protein QOD60_1582 [Solirubrobacterales bacterium]|jgi:hypothetical protein|nr:hypothetical protein [Solirubrobacterales bacterium]
MNRARRLRGVIGVALLAACFAPPSASAETVTIGSPLTNNWTIDYACGSGCMMLQHAAGAGAPLPQASPVNGVINAWAVRSNLIGSVFSLRVLRPAGGLTFGVTGSSSALTATSAAGDAVTRYPASHLPIRQGDQVALSNAEGGGAIPIHLQPASGFTVAFGSTGGPPDGATETFTDNGTGNDRELLFQATISFCRIPDVLGRKVADAQRLIATAGCTATTKTRKLKKTRRNKKKKGTVLAQSLAGGASAAPGTAVELTVAAVKKK